MHVEHGAPPRMSRHRLAVAIIKVTRWIGRHAFARYKRWSCTLLSRRTPRLERLRRLQPGDPTAPASDDVPLLSSDPGGVSRLAPRRTQLSSPREADSPETYAPLEKGFDLARADCESDIRRCFRAPLAPHLARPSVVYARLEELSKSGEGGI